MKRTQIYLEDEQDKRLAEQAHLTGRTKSDIIREAVDRQLDGRHDESAALARFRSAVDATAGIARSLPAGVDYVDQVRAGDRRRQQELEAQWRR